MKKIFLLVGIIFLSINTYSQLFTEKPFTVAQSWLDKNLSQNRIKSVVPDNYELVSEDVEKLVFERQISPSKTYNIMVFYKKGEISGVMFTLHSSKAFKLLLEIEKLDYKIIDEVQLSGMELNSYVHPDKGYKLGCAINSIKRIVIGSINKP